jgi:hypothetical protein
VKLPKKLRNENLDNITDIDVVINKGKVIDPDKIVK